MKTFKFRPLLADTVILAALICLISTSASALEPISMAEVKKLLFKYANLPVYCQVRLTQRDISLMAGKTLPMPFAKTVGKWEKIIGHRNWLYFHHYAFGVQKYQKAIQIFPDTEGKEFHRGNILKSALGEFAFVRERVDQSFPLWEQLYLYESYIFQLLNRPDLALQRKMQAERFKQRKKK